jgi:hypothetical protein
MSVNDTGADCTICGSYNCSYICTECLLVILLQLGIDETKALKILANHWIELEPYQIDEAKRQVAKREAKG